MKKQLLLSLILAFITIPKSNNMFDPSNLDPKVVSFCQTVVSSIAKEAADIAKTIKYNSEQNYNEQMDKLEKDLKDTKNEQERLMIRKQIADLQQSKLKKEERMDKLEAEIAGILPNAGNAFISMIKEQQAADNRLNETYVKAETEKEASIAKHAETIKQSLEFIKDPKNAKLLVGIATGVSLGVFGAWHGTKLAANLIQRYMHKVPTIAEETSLISYKQKLINYLTSKHNESQISDVILDQNLSERIEKIAYSLQNTVKNNGYFRHMLFYGPPGTGKTMLAKRLARSSGLEYIYFAGGSALDQLPIEEALSKLTELFEFAKLSKKKLMIIIDEAEVLLADRSKNLSDKTRKLLNLILGYTGTETNNFIIAALTNRPEDLDDAFLSRCDEQINIGAPAFEQRKAILESYINKLLIERTQEKPKPSLFSRLMGASIPPKALTIDADVFDQKSLEEIAIKLENFVGRDISKFVIAIQSEAYASSDCHITKALVNRVLEQKLNQKNMELKFKNT